MNLIVAITIAIFVYTLQKHIYRKSWNRNLDVKLSFTDTCVSVGDSGMLVEQIHNAKALPMPVLHVKFSVSRTFLFDDSDNSSVTDSYYRNDVFSIAGNRRITRRLKFTATKRGLFQITGIQLGAKDFFLSETFASRIKSDAWMYVLPKRYESPDFQAWLQQLIGENEIHRGLNEDPFTFRGIRDYSTQDTMRKVNWKATARTGDLKVNIYGYSSSQRVCILLNLEPNSMIRIAEMQEITIGMTSTVAAQLLENKIPTQICSSGIDILSGECGKVSFGASMDHCITIDKYLARIREHAGLETFSRMLDEQIQNLQRDITYLVISPYYKEDLLLKLDEMVRLGVDVKMLVPYYDVQELANWRPYMHGWEVKLVEI
ncbi:MAG: DUF58 domain-containing protein [Wujia sp.]